MPTRSNSRAHTVRFRVNRQLEEGVPEQNLRPDGLVRTPFRYARSGTGGEGPGEYTSYIALVEASGPEEAFSVVRRYFPSPEREEQACAQSR